LALLNETLLAGKSELTLNDVLLALPAAGLGDVANLRVEVEDILEDVGRSCGIVGVDGVGADDDENEIDGEGAGRGAGSIFVLTESTVDGAGRVFTSLGDEDLCDYCTETSCVPTAELAGDLAVSDQPPVSAILDSGSDKHVLSMAAAKEMLADRRGSNLQLVGVSQEPVKASVMGELTATLRNESGRDLNFNFGRAYGLEKLPLNILSVSLLEDRGGIFHAERGNRYLQLTSSHGKIPVCRRGGFYEIELRQDTRSGREPAAYGSCYGVAVSLADWHRRMYHLSHHDLATIYKNNLVDGFIVKGRPEVNCGCEVCRMAKIKRTATPRVTDIADTPLFVGHTVSADVKVVPYESFCGYKYAVFYVDHYSRMRLVYCVRSKVEVVDTLDLLARQLKRYNWRLRRLQTDRGSEFFSQEGLTLTDRDRRQSEYTRRCDELGALHVVVPTGSHEKMAEVAIRDAFDAVNAMLYAARLSPAFWADAVEYYADMYNNTPNRHVGPTTPRTMMTGLRSRWDKYKVFGGDVYEHIANNDLAKVPGIPKGRRAIFVGLDEERGGFKVFYPNTRSYGFIDNGYVYESFAHRIDNLRHHDTRRELMKKGLDQPVVLDEFELDNTFQIDSVRNVFTSADPPGLEGELGISGSEGEIRLLGDTVSEGASVSRGAAERAQLTKKAQKFGPFAEVSLEKEKADQELRRVFKKRPVRVAAVGIRVKCTEEDKTFLDFAKKNNIQLVLVDPCPKREKRTGNSSRERYLKYMYATRYSEMIALGATPADFSWDYEHGWISFPGHEPDAPGHIFHAASLAAKRGNFGDDTAPAFSQLVAQAFDIEPVLAVFGSRVTAEKFGEICIGKVFSTEGVEIDWSLEPEPTSFQQAASGPEASFWIAGCKKEWSVFKLFNVYTAVKKTDVIGKQIVRVMWIFRRKIGPDGKVSDYRPRAVALGCHQKPYMSFNPDSITSPTVRKSSLRMLLAMCTQLNMTIYQADVRAAFLQAPLREEVYARFPPGCEEYDENGEEMVMRLNKAVYGLKQAAACFWEALYEHLTSKGFQTTYGDPCVFQKRLPDGSLILVCTYVDDITFGVSSQANADDFMALLRERFVIAEDEGQPISWLLGMKITQDVQAGTTRMTMEAATAKLCESVLTKEELVKSSDVVTPMAITPLTKNLGDIIPTSEFNYLSVVGSMLHLSVCVRFDIAYAVGVLARYAKNPGRQHVRAARRVLMYLYNTRGLGIVYTRTESVAMPVVFEGAKHPLCDSSIRDPSHPEYKLPNVFVDSDYAGDETKQSTMGLVVFMNGAPVDYCSVLSKSVAQSTCEAEVYAATLGAKQALHVSQFLQDTGFTKEWQPLTLAEDNAACIAQAKAGLRSIRNAKHYEVKLRFLQQLVLEKKVSIEYCPTDKQLADFFTKPLDEAKFIKFRRMLGMQ
jgi:hypothetical protein